jgi:SAM-dependent methyltransferase
MTAAEFPWPDIDGGWRPEWLGAGFRVGGKDVPVLAYDCGDSGWSNTLTRMHEEAAGPDHPIDRLSRAWAVSALRRHVQSNSPVLLEVGCSSGFLLRELHEQWPAATTIGADFVREPLERLAAAVNDIPLMQFDLVRCPLPSECVDAVVLLNVLEHIDKDRAAMRHAVRVLKPGGIAIVEVPAGPHLYDVYDEYLQHCRRYSAASLASLMVDAGLELLHQSHLGFILYPAFALVKRRNRRHAGDSLAGRRIVESHIRQTRHNLLLREMLRWEAWLGRLCSFPFGIRCVAVGRKSFATGNMKRSPR